MQLTQSSTQSTKPAKPSIGLFLLYIFAAIALVIFIGYPKFTDWKTANTRLTTDKQTLAQVQTSAAEVKTEISSIQPTDATKISAAIPATPNLPDLYAQVESLANAATVHLVSIQGIVDAAATSSTAGSLDAGTDMSTGTTATTVSTDASGNPLPAGPIKVTTLPSVLGTVSLSVDVSGQYSAVQQFLNSLYTSLRIITVQQTIMSTGKSGASTGGAGATSANAPASIDLKAQLQTYYSK